KALHGFFKVFVAVEISADEIRFSAYVFTLTDRREKLIAICLVILNACVSLFLRYVCFHNFNSPFLDYFCVSLPFGGAKINGWAKVFLFQVFLFVFARDGETNALYPCKKVTNRLRSNGER